MYIRSRGETMNGQTIIQTSKGTIEVLHQITLGDIILSTILMAMLIFIVLDRVIRR
jgi:hypothetical protein